jgi:bifunctional DNA-binding transcriptional regulator/antitoxin component of YhaV-PrlF toxin-antitoxin module
MITLPEEILKEANLKEGDVIVWKDNKDGSYTLEKKPVETEIVLVETVSIFRIRYAVKVPKGKQDWALDTVSMNEANELSQKHLSEQIVSHRVIRQEDFFDLVHEGNDYVSNWEDAKKEECFLTEVDEKGNVVA